MEFLCIGRGVHHLSGIFILRGGGTPPKWNIYPEGGGYTTSVEYLSKVEGVHHLSGPQWDTPVALVKVTQPSVAQPHSLTDPLLSLFDNNPNLQAIVLQLHDSDARAVVEHVKKSCGGRMSLYLREWEMPDGSPGIHVSGDVAAGWRKWECKAQQVQRGHWEDTAPLYSLHSQSPWSWHADLEGHTFPTWYKGTGMHPSLFFPLTTTPLFGVELHRVSIPVDVVNHRHVDDLKDF